MKRNTYLNGVLTAIAVLLGALVWIQVTASESGNQALAQSRTERRGLPNAAAQRKAIVDAIKELQKEVESQNKVFESGTLKVHVVNIKELSQDSEEAEKRRLP